MDYISRAAQARVVDVILDAMLDVGDLTDERFPEEQERLLQLSIRQLRNECDIRCPGDWDYLT